MRNFILFLVAVVFIFSCETNPPTLNENEFGTLSVSSNLDGEKDSIAIFVDSKFTGHYSPYNLQLNAGLHEVFLKYDSVFSPTQNIEIFPNKITEAYFTFSSTTTKKVLLEDFANISCDPCVISSQIISNLLENRYNNGQVIVLRYATNFPSPNDPFYLSNTNLFDERISFYNILFAPTTIVDGLNKPISTDSNDIVLSIENALQNETDFTIDVTSEVAQDSIKATVSLIYPANSNLTNLYLFVALVENKVTFNEPPGSNGETSFEHVVVDMFTDYGGESLSSKGDKTFYFSLPNNYAISSSNLKVVAFIQNIITKEILQTNSN